MRLILGLILLCGVTAPSSPAPVQAWEKRIAPGIVFRSEIDPNLPRVVNAIRLSPGTPGLKWMPELAGGTINEAGSVKGRRTPSQMAHDSGAIIAVNGDFFSYEHGAPIGQFVRDGQLITTPMKARAGFAWGDQDSFVGLAASNVYMKVGDEAEARISGVNQPLGGNGIVLFTSAEGTVAPPAANAAAVLRLSETDFRVGKRLTATVLRREENLGAGPVPAGQAYLIATGVKSPMVERLKEGDEVTLRLQADGFDWSRVQNQIGGGPFLVRGGRIAVDAQEEGFKPEFIARNPRTAIGRTADGDVWIATVDGRQAGSVGATLDELAALMAHLGCVDAINLDGGGSTAIDLFGMTVGRPSDGVERPVATGILVYGPTPTAPEGKLEMVAKRPAADGTIAVSVQRNGQPVPNADVVWAAKGAGWIDQGGLIHPIRPGVARIFARVYGKPLAAEVPVMAGDASVKVLPADKD